MGLFDKIKDNARDLSMRAIEATREEVVYEEEADNKPSVPVAETQPDTVQENQADEEMISQPSDEQIAEETASEPEKAEASDSSKEETPKPEEPTRKSKVIEISKAEYESNNQAKKVEATKQAAKERLAKNYTPSYKADKKPAKAEPKAPAEAPAKKSRPISVGIIDITPGKFTDPTKQAIYARERAALTALASRRKLDGTVPLYVATHMSFRTRVFVDRIEYSGSFGKTSLPVNQIAWVKLRAGGTGVILETTEGKRVVMVVKPADRLDFAEAILKVQSMMPKTGKFKDTKTVRIDELEKFSEGVDELEKLAKLFDKGILSQEEFDAKKKQILGI